MGRPAAAGSSSKALLALVFLLVAGVAAALWIALGESVGPDEPQDGGPAASEPSDPGGTGGVVPAGGPSGRPPKPGPAPAISGFAAVRGQVRLFKTREPVAGVPLTLRSAEGAPLAATTDAAGAFSFASVPAGPGWELRGGRDGFAPLEITGIDLAPEQALDVGVLWLAVPVDLPARVVDTTGRPVEGAEVAAFALGRTLPEEADQWSDEAREQRTLSLVSNPRPSRTAKTDARGNATVSGLMPGAYRAVAAAPGLAAASRAGLVLVPDAKPEVVTFVLAPAHALEGAVTDEKDAPVAKARVIAARLHGWLPSLDKAFADTGADGTYRIDGLDVGQHLLYLARPGLPLLQVGQVQIPENTRFDVRLRPGGTIRGTVTDEAGKPVADADVRVAMQTTWSPMVAKTDKEGAFELKDVPAGAIAYFRVRADGFIPYPEPAANQQGSGESLREGQTMVRDVALRRGRSATVTVTGEGRGPVEGAEVRVHYAAMWGDTARPWRGVTDAKGVCTATGLMPGAHVVVVVAEGWVQKGLPPAWPNLLSAAAAIPPSCRVSIEPDSDASIAVTMVRGLSVSGRVLDPTGKTYAGGATVTVEGAHSEFPVFSGPDGRFRVDAVQPLRRSVATATAPNGSSGQSEAFQILPGKPADDVEVRMKETGRITGTVRSGDGRAAVAAVVRWFRGSFSGGDPSNWPGFESVPRIPVAADGSFEIPSVPGGDITVRADAQGALPGSATVQVAPGVETGGVTLTLGAAASIRGRVTARGGAAVRGATVGAQFQGGRGEENANYTTGASGNPVAQTDAEGRFELRGLCPGQFVVTASASGFAGGAAVETSTDAGEVLLELAPGKSISGFVRDPAGKPLGGIPVTAERSDDGNGGSEEWGWWWGGGSTVYSAPDGSFEIQELAEGAYKLRVSGAWQWGREVNVEATVKEGVAAGAKDVEIVVRAGLVIEGFVHDRAKKPVRSGWISSSFQATDGGWDWESQRWVQVGADGRFRLTGLKPGSYDVQAWGNFRAVTKSGVAAGATDVDIEVEDAHTISGVVLDDRGLSVEGFNVQLRRNAEEGWNWWGCVQPGDGEFIVTGLEEGAFDLQVQADGYAPTILPRVAADTADLQVRVGRGLSIAGVVVDAAGAPRRGVWVSIEATKLAEGSPDVSDGVTTDDLGRFRKTGLVPGQYRVSARAENSAPAIVRGVAAGAEDLKLVLTRGTTITGRVSDRDGAAVPEVSVTAWSEDGVWIAAAGTGEDGAFTISGVPAGGSWKLVVDGALRGENVNHTHEPLVESGAADVKIEVKPKQ